MYVVEARDDTGAPVHYLSIVPPTRGLCSEAILGRLTAGPDQLAVEHVVPNPVFVRFLHWVIARHASACPGLVAEVQRQRDGYVYISDARAVPVNGKIALEDILGYVEIEEGKILRFVGWPDYRALTRSGPPQLDPWLHERWMTELAARLPEPA